MPRSLWSRRGAALAGVILGLLAASGWGCSDEPDPVACAAYAAAGLGIEVIDAATGQPICDAVVTASEGSYSEPLQVFSCRYVGAWERPGTYLLRVERDGFVPAERSGVRVVESGGPCPHVQEVRLRIPLCPASGEPACR